MILVLYMINKTQPIKIAAEFTMTDIDAHGTHNVIYTKVMYTTIAGLKHDLWFKVADTVNDTTNRVTYIALVEYANEK
jgi:hypothetical protein